MASEEHLARLRLGKEAWNDWRHDNPDEFPILNDASLRESDFSGYNLANADLTGADLLRADLEGAFLVDAYAQMADFRGAKLSHAAMSCIDLGAASLNNADLRHARLGNAFLAGAQLAGADLRNADLTEADLSFAQLSEARIDGAKLSGARVYAVAAWSLDGEPAEQDHLVVTRWESTQRTVQARLTVDSVEEAQLAHLILDKKVGRVFNTLTRKAVLLLGRFDDQGLSALDTIADWLRRNDYLPLLFTFDRPESLDFTETVVTAAGLSRFLIADIGRAHSVPQELQAILPTIEIPTAMILRKGDEAWSTARDHHRRPHVLPRISFHDEADLTAHLGKLVDRLKDLQDRLDAEKNQEEQEATPIDKL